jgi:hypothetical protein
MLVSSEGCELYLLPPAAFGFTPGEDISFAEVQEVGRMMRRTPVGVTNVLSGGSMTLVPDPQYRWRVQASDRVAVIAVSW